MFTATLFTTAKTWRQTKCPTDEFIRKMWYTYTMIYHSAINKSEIMPFETTSMDLETVMLSKLNRGKKMISLHAESKKMLQMNLYTKQKQTHRHRNKFMATEGERLREGIN